MVKIATKNAVQANDVIFKGAVTKFLAKNKEELPTAHTNFLIEWLDGPQDHILLLPFASNFHLTAL